MVMVMGDWSVWRAAVEAHRDGHLGGRPGVPVPEVNAGLWSLLGREPGARADLVDLLGRAEGLLTCGAECSHVDWGVVRELTGVLWGVVGGDGL
jgi:hypothetical protein